MPLLRVTLRLIIGIYIHIDYAVRRTRVIRSCSPSPAPQFDLTQFFQRHTTPV
jgi:hypothetical protein